MGVTMIRCLLLVWVVLMQIGCETKSGSNSVYNYREQLLPSGGKVKIIGLNLAFGDRTSGSQDVMILSYQTTFFDPSNAYRKKEAYEVFELVRPMCEQWSLNGANLMAFHGLNEKGDFWAIRFRRGADGKWTFEEMPGKVY